MKESIEIQQENKMGIMSEHKLLITMSLPMIISMLVQALYNIIDSIFVSQINENALTALSLAFPIQNLMIAVAAGLCVGVNALLSRSLGEKNQEKANDAAVQGIFLMFLGYLLFLIIGITATKAFMMAQTDIVEIVEYGTTYLTICCIFSFGIFGQFIFERLLQSTGKTLYTMFTQLTGAIINIILDPILIFGYFGFPEMGVAGAALATVIGQIVAAIAAIWMNKRKNTEIHVSFKGFRPKKLIIKSLLIVGIPSIIMQAIGSIMNYGLNRILLGFTSTATAVFGAYFKLQSFVFMPVFGLNNGMVPIIAYNFGARKKARMMKTLKLSIMYAVGIMLIGFVVMQFFPQTLLKMFNADDNMLSIGVPALRIISINFMFAGYCIITSSFFQALGKGLQSMFLSIARQLVFLLPAAYLLSKTGKLSAVWWAFPISEIASLIICTTLLITIYNKVIKKIA